MTTLLGLTGLIMYGIYRDCDPLLHGDIERRDQVNKHWTTSLSLLTHWSRVTRHICVNKITIIVCSSTHSLRSVKQSSQRYSIRMPRLSISMRRFAVVASVQNRSASPFERMGHEEMVSTLAPAVSGERCLWDSWVIGSKPPHEAIRLQFSVTLLPLHRDMSKTKWLSRLILYYLLYVTAGPFVAHWFTWIFAWDSWIIFGDTFQCIVKVSHFYIIIYMYHYTYNLISRMCVCKTIKIKWYLPMICRFAIVIHLVILSNCIRGVLRRQRKWFHFFFIAHDDVIKWKHFRRYWPFVRGIHRSPVNSPHTGQWRGALMFSLICVWINGWVNNREAGDLRRYRVHYDVSVMEFFRSQYPVFWNERLVCNRLVWCRHASLSTSDSLGHIGTFGHFGCQDAR